MVAAISLPAQAAGCRQTIWEPQFLRERRIRVAAGKPEKSRKRARLQRSFRRVQRQECCPATWMPMRPKFCLPEQLLAEVCCFGVPLVDSPHNASARAQPGAKACWTAGPTLSPTLLLCYPYQSPAPRRARVLVEPYAVMIDPLRFCCTRSSGSAPAYGSFQAPWVAFIGMAPLTASRCRPPQKNRHSSLRGAGVVVGRSIISMDAGGATGQSRPHLGSFSAVWITDNSYELHF